MEVSKVISKESFSKDWISKQRGIYPKADPQLIERQLYAFELVGLLAKLGKPFVFKGGTSLLLLLPTAHRLSIDIDIVGNFRLEELISLSKSSIFIRAEEDERRESKVPKRHFKYFYRSNIDGRESYVLLDVLSSEHGYPKLITLPIQSPIFRVEEKLSVAVPTINGILGDKLTAYAPKTIGVPFGAGKSMEIIKQLLDIGELFGACDDLAEVSSSYSAFEKQERSYRENVFNVDEVLNDTIETSYFLCQSQLKGCTDNGDIQELHQGIKQIQSYLLGAPFRIEDARLSAAKAAFIATAIRKNKLDLDLRDARYTELMTQQIASVTLEGRLAILNRLKSTQTETFYYWWLISKM